MAAVDIDPPVEREPQPPKRSLWRRYEKKIVPYLYISPFFLVFAAFGVFTVGFTFWVSLHDWPMLAGFDRSRTEFVGLGNYVQLLTDDPRLIRAVTNTFSILLITVTVQIVVGLILAEILNDRTLRGPNLFRSGLLMPNITSVVAVAIIFGLIFGRHAGIVNALLGFFGIDPINWHATRLHSHLALATMINWRWTGYQTLIFLAAMHAIPRDYHEAAMVDGANRAQRWWRISIPLLRPAILFVTLLAVIGTLQLFAEPLLFGEGVSSTSGGSNNQYLTVMLYLYDRAFSAPFRFGYAAAIAWLLVGISLISAALVYAGSAMLRRREDRAARAHMRQREKVTA